MATAAVPLVSLASYLKTSDYEPDADFVEGRIEERSLGELDHSSLQKAILLLLSAKEFRSCFRSYPELRVRVAPERVRIPDVCLIALDAPREQVVQTPPVLCVEVLSPEDRMSRMMTRIRDFLEMGVPEVWIVDPATRTVQVCTGTGIVIHRSGQLRVPGTSATLSLQEIFQVLDE